MAHHCRSSEIKNNRPRPISEKEFPTRESLNTLHEFQTPNPKKGFPEKQIFSKKHNPEVYPKESKSQQAKHHSQSPENNFDTSDAFSKSRASTPLSNLSTASTNLTSISRKMNSTPSLYPSSGFPQVHTFGGHFYPGSGYPSLELESSGLGYPEADYPQANLPGVSKEMYDGSELNPGYPACQFPGEKRFPGETEDDGSQPFIGGSSENGLNDMPFATSLSALLKDI